MANAFVNPPLPRYYSASTDTSSSSYPSPHLERMIRNLHRQTEEIEKEEKAKKAIRAKVREPILFDIKNLDIKKE